MKVKQIRNTLISTLIILSLLIQGGFAVGDEMSPQNDSSLCDHVHADGYHIDHEVVPCACVHSFIHISTTSEREYYFTQSSCFRMKYTEIWECRLCGIGKYVTSYSSVYPHDFQWDPYGIILTCTVCGYSMPG